MASQVFEVKAKGKTLKFSTRLEQGDVDDFLAWVREQEGDPLEELKEWLPLMPEAEKGKLFREARDRKNMMKCMHLGSPLVQQYQQTPEGAIRMAMMSLRKHHPDLTREDVLEILEEVDPSEMQRFQKQVEATNRSRAKNGDAPNERGQSTGASKPILPLQSDAS